MALAQINRGPDRKQKPSALDRTAQVMGIMSGMGSLYKNVAPSPKIQNFEQQSIADYASSRLSPEMSKRTQEVAGLYDEMRKRDGVVGFGKKRMG